jgi:hypothetical protein
VPAELVSLNKSSHEPCHAVVFTSALHRWLSLWSRSELVGCEHPCQLPGISAFTWRLPLAHQMTHGCSGDTDACVWLVLGTLLMSPAPREPSVLHQCKQGTQEPGFKKPCLCARSGHSCSFLLEVVGAGVTREGDKQIPF